MTSLPSVEALATRIDAPGGGSLERLAVAVRTADELHGLADRVVDRYVHAARADGQSWSRIGHALGVSKQAAQKRFVGAPESWPGMSDAAAAVLSSAAGEARALGHRYLGTEHVLLALAPDNGLAGAALAQLGVSPDGVREQIRRLVGTGRVSETATLGITPRTKRVLEAARKEARRVGHRCADVEHVAIAVSEHEGVAEQILRESGSEPGAVRDTIAELLERQAPELAERLRRPARRRLRRTRA